MLCVQMHPAGASDPDKIPKLNSRNNKGGGGGARTRELRNRDTTAWLDIPFCFDTAFCIFVKLRRGSDKDRQGMALKAKGLKA